MVGSIVAGMGRTFVPKAFLGQMDVGMAWYIFTYPKTAQCMAYLPTKLGSDKGVNVGTYTIQKVSIWGLGYV